MIPIVLDWHDFANFSRWEFACRCCGLESAAYDLVKGLQTLRTALGRPIHVTSGCRCKRHNRRVGGSKHSMHLASDQLVCRAADIVIVGMTVDQMYNAVLTIPAFANGGIGAYPWRGFVHVDTRTTQARWGQYQDRAYTSVMLAMQEYGPVSPGGFPVGDEV